jgi:hypothetical protein
MIDVQKNRMEIKTKDTGLKEVNQLNDIKELGEGGRRAIPGHVERKPLRVSSKQQRALTRFYNG